MSQEGTGGAQDRLWSWSGGRTGGEQDPAPLLCAHTSTEPAAEPAECETCSGDECPTARGQSCR